MASDSDSDEDFVTYGTPLEPFEEGRVTVVFVFRLKYVHIIYLKCWPTLSQQRRVLDTG